MPSNFGVFAPVFESAHSYLALLNLSADDSADSVRLVRRCASEDVDRSGTLNLLADLNWRPTLVAAVAAIFQPTDTRVIAALWHRFDSGSWVTPQIGIILSIIDPDFLIRARERLEAHCPVDFSELRACSAPERHSAAGPAGGTERSAKAANALRSIILNLTAPPEWVSEILNSPEHQALVALDVDSADVISERWAARLAQIRQ